MSHPVLLLCCINVTAEARDEVDDAMDDYLEELRDLLGVPTDPEYYQNQNADDQTPDAESRQELQRLLQHLHDPVTPGAPYTVLQVCLLLVGSCCNRHFSRTPLVWRCRPLSSKACPGGVPCCGSVSAVVQ